MAAIDQKSAFNTPLETGLRSLAILLASYPSRFDLQRLVELDYLVVHSGDANGPESLHAALPLRAGELLVRRNLVDRGLMLMVSRRLAERNASVNGFEYAATDLTAPFFSKLQSEYTLQLRERAKWAVETFGGFSAEDIRAVTRGFFERWSSQFHPPHILGTPI